MNFSKSSVIKTLLISMLLFAIPPTLFAETKYVIDEHVFPLRSGKTTGYRIIQNLKSGTPVQVLEKDEESGWIRAQTSSGKEGWIENRYLRSTPSSKEQLLKLQAMLKRMKQSGSSLESRMIDMEQKNESLESEKQTLTRSNSTLDKKLKNLTALSKNAIRLDRTNNELIQKNQQFEIDIEQLAAERDKLKYDNRNTGLKLGALILIAGIVLGVVAPMFKPSKKDSGWA